MAALQPGHGMLPTDQAQQQHQQAPAGMTSRPPIASQPPMASRPPMAMQQPGSSPGPGMYAQQASMHQAFSGSTDDQAYNSAQPHNAWYDALHLSRLHNHQLSTLHCCWYGMYSIHTAAVLTESQRLLRSLPLCTHADCIRQCSSMACLSGTNP